MESTRRSTKTCNACLNLDSKGGDKDCQSCRRLYRSTLKKKHQPQKRDFYSLSYDEPLVPAAESFPQSHTLIKSPHSSNQLLTPDDTTGRAEIKLQYVEGHTFHLRHDKRDTAVSFFFDHFAESHLKWLRPVFDAVKGLYNTAGLERSPVAVEVTTAVAFAAMANYPDMRHLATPASQAYHKALRLTNQALADPEKSKADDVLLSIFMLTWYERVTGERQSPQRVARHAAGSIALLRHRGAEQFKSPISMKLFSVIRNAMILECAIFARPIAANDLKGFWFARLPEKDDLVGALFHCASLLPLLRYRAAGLFASGNLGHNLEEVYSLLADTRGLDSKLIRWHENLPLHDWSFSTTTQMISSLDDDVKAGEIWPGPMHHYKDMYCASTLNTYRLFRILAQSIIAQCLSCLDMYEVKPRSGSRKFLYMSTSYVAQLLVEEIAASVPSQLTFRTGGGPRSGGVQQRLNANEALGAFYLIKPLWIAGNVEGIGSTLSHWMRTKLRAMHDHYGYEEAHILSEAKTCVRMTWPQLDNQRILTLRE